MSLALIFPGQVRGQGDIPDEENVPLEKSGASSVQPGSQDMIARRVGGLPVLRCTIQYDVDEIEAHLLFDPGLAVPFQIHQSSVYGLGLDPQFAAGLKVDIMIGRDVELRGIPIETERYRFLEEHTRIHAGELDEVPLVGMIGPSAFGSNVVELDLGQELLRTMGIATDAAREAEIPYQTENGKIIVNGTGPAGTPVRATLTTRMFDVVLAPPLLEQARKNDAKPNTLSVGGVAWGERSAIRFDSTGAPEMEVVNAIIGVEALANCTVTIWPKRAMIAVRARTTGPFPQVEQEYFLAVADRRPEPVEKFIETAPRRRLLDEACLELWTIRLEDPGSSVEALRGALDTIAGKYWPGSRSEALLNLVDALEAGRHARREELAEYALELAIRESGKAVEATTVHDVHVRIGRRALAKGDLRQARRHLLSAAFGMPKSAECNYWLGEVYRETGWLQRAWSRYFQALLDETLEEDDPICAQALQRLGELNSNSEFRKEFDMVLAEQYMTGRLIGSEFHAGTRYRFVKKQYPHHVRMVELFIDSSVKESGGMELAFQALDEFFEDDVVLVSYHLNDPMHTEASRQRLAVYAKGPAPLAVFDGEPKVQEALGDGEKLAEDAAANYPGLRRACLPGSAPEDEGWRISADIVRDGLHADVGVTVEGEASPDGLNLVVLLCERSIMALDENGVYFHHFVVRDLLTPAEGVGLAKVLDDPARFDVEVSKLREKVGAGDARPFVDASQLFVVGLVQRRSDSRILAARRFGFPPEEEQ